MEFHHKKDQSIQSLVELGTLGFFPLFETSWIEEVSQTKHKKMTGNEKQKAKKLFQRIVQHKSLDRKRTVIFSMSSDERRLLVKAFLVMVEGKIMDDGPEIQ